MGMNALLRGHQFVKEGAKEVFELVDLCGRQIVLGVDQIKV
jgi:hypothetical protein